jgi:carboxymethylenebutenolidase
VCVDGDSRPPIAPIAGAAVDSRSSVLTAPDGNRLRAFEARGESAPTAGAVLVLPDVRGLHPFYEELALRFAESGIDSLAVDYFGRSAGTDRRGDDFEHRPHVEQLTWDGLRADVAAGAARLREGGDRRIVTVGFCMGGRLSFLCGTLADVAPAGVVGFYGPPAGPGRAGMPAPVDVVDAVGSAVLGLFGGADPGIPTETIDAFERALGESNVEHEVVVYPGAPHSFFDRKQAEFATESADAWARTLGFVRRHALASTRG